MRRDKCIESKKFVRTISYSIKIGEVLLSNCTHEDKHVVILLFLAEKKREKKTLVLVG
jgi:hypothetical protein